MKKLIIIPISFLFLACVFTSNMSNKMETYKNFNSQISIKLEDVLPLKNINEIEKRDFVNAVYPEGIYAIGYSAYFVGFTYSLQEFEAELNYIKNKCKIVNEKETINYISATQKKRDGIIVPDMNDSFNNTDHFINDKPVCYLYKNGKGEFLNSKFSSYYTETSNIQHGYQSGAMIDEKSKKIVYWLLIW